MRADIGRALRLARISRGLSQELVARTSGISQSHLSAVELCQVDAGIGLLSTIAHVVGMRLSATLFPAGVPVRDAGHIRVTGRLRRLLPASFRWRTEVPLPQPGDPRSLDAIIVEPRIDAAFEIESKLVDAQALARRATLKLRDSTLKVMVLVLPDTAGNREAVRGAAATLRPSFPIGSRAILGALRKGQTPAASGILFV